VKYENYSADDKDAAGFVDKAVSSISLGSYYNIDENFASKLSYKYMYGNYEDSISREDRFHKIDLKLIYSLYKYTYLNLSEQYVKNNTNYSPAEYNKNITMFGIDIRY